MLMITIDVDIMYISLFSFPLIRNQFRARPIPPGLFKGGDQCTGIPQVSALNKIPLTTPVSPNITKPIVNKRDTSDNENEIQPEKKFKVINVYNTCTCTYVQLYILGASPVFNSVY